MVMMANQVLQVKQELPATMDIMVLMATLAHLELMDYPVLQELPG